MITLCKACGTSYAFQGSRPQQCQICQDARQFVPPEGQSWVDVPLLLSSHTNSWQQHETSLLSLTTVPAFAIGQRAFLLRTPAGNILWDCITTLDEATRTLISALGGLHAIAISHPHFYTTMQDWAAAFGAPVYLHSSDSHWIMRESPHIRLWEGETLALAADVTVMRLGGHFPGSCVLHWENDGGALFTGDTLQVTPGADAVSFMWSYPNLLPLPGPVVSDIADRLRAIRFNRLYGGFTGKEITGNADHIVQRSAQRYLDCLEKSQ
ncbi:MBL fold metallo-hydrolase [Yokenella regensburgei]|uniref:MBL fold metallo-hydrolase n=1 Tax=Yokenella regensburgei TaxID=158877 RepID=UPI003F142123